MPIPSVNVAIRDPGLGIVEGPAANAQCVIGVTSQGVANTFYAYQTISDLVSNLGTGPGVEAAALALSIDGHGSVYLVRPQTSVAGSNSVVTPSGSGPLVAVSGTPLDDYQGVVRIVSDGAVGTATFVISLDGGDNFSSVITTAASYPIPGTGLTAAFPAGTYVANDTYSWNSLAPAMNVTDLVAALDAAVAGTPRFGILHIVGAPATAIDAATLAASVEVKLQEIAASKKRWLRALIHVPDVPDASLVSAFGNVAASRVCACAGFAETVSAVSLRAYKRSSGFAVAARVGAAPLSEHLGRVASGSLIGVRRIYRDEAVTERLDAARFTTLRTWVGRQGYYITRGRLLAPAGSDYQQIQLGRIADVACTAVYDRLLDYENDSVRVYPLRDAKAGRILESDARAIDTELEAVLKDVLVNTTPQHVSDVQARVVRTDNILSTAELRAEIAIVPKGYLEVIRATIALTNPAIRELEAA
ncbi:DUF2586 domain-containing protein [Pendulispora brunnea]|uniref:DUF2586 domain-containing protein n=1 Tax=Pendulispora brunnea TaxID=2905690 RepID=A0ABZ2K7B0_9BACT